MEGCRIEKYDEKNYPNIFVDADSCPVKEDILQISNTYGYEVIFVASYAHYSNTQPDSNWVYVDSEREEVDLYIMNHSKAKDIIITQDIGLASILVKRKSHVLSPKGKKFNENEMEDALYRRYVSAKERRSGELFKRSKSIHRNGSTKLPKCFRKKFVGI